MEQCSAQAHPGPILKPPTIIDWREEPRLDNHGQGAQEVVSGHRVKITPFRSFYDSGNYSQAILASTRVGNFFPEQEDHSAMYRPQKGDTRTFLVDG